MKTKNQVSFKAGFGKSRHLGFNLLKPRKTRNICIIFLYIPIFLLSFSMLARADEGMWLPMLLKNNIADMQAKGLKLSADDLYSVNNSSIKDAVVNIRGCTGEMISDKGLMLTNHHCGLGQIQTHSTLEHDYLTNGFWAAQQTDELPCPEVTARFVVGMSDVTADILKGIKQAMPTKERNSMIDSNTQKLIEANKIKDSTYIYSVSSMFNGNQYILFTYQEFKDVRLVGAPPASIGKFGGDTDNWMWPRHTGDFCLFRIYADANNKPAEYSADNKPYRPKHHFKISLEGIQENDFTLVYGFPGRTMEYLPSFAIKNVVEQSDPHKIRLRQMRLDLMNQLMDSDPEVRIKYMAKSAGVANAWKKWIGELKGLQRLKAIDKKEAFERDFSAWTATESGRKAKYSDILPRMDSLYTAVRPFALLDDYYRESFQAVELIAFANKFEKLAEVYKQSKNVDSVQKILKKDVLKFYKDYYQDYDRKMFANMINAYRQYIPEGKRPNAIDSLYNLFQGDLSKLSQTAFDNTFFNKSEKVLALTDSITPDLIAELEQDFFYRLWINVSGEHKSKIMPTLTNIGTDLATLQTRYMEAQIAFNNKKLFYPDANSTLRVAYGKVSGFRPIDGVIYDYYTTLDGIIDKDNPTVYDYRVPQRLKELWQNKDYGRYANSMGQLPVAFIATNHTTGGNSGSPVLNAQGNLIGLNFDRCWESTMSDYMFDPAYCRNIAVDIRYVLFLMDKYAGAQRLINELSIVE